MLSAEKKVLATERFYIADEEMKLKIEDCDKTLHV